MRSGKIVFLALVFAVLVGCTAETTEIFSGCYTVNKGEPPFLKIAKEGAKYALYLRSGNQWSKAVPLHAGTEKEQQAAFGKDAAKIKASLIAENNPIAVFRITAGDTIAGKKVDSDYFAMLIVGAGPVYKIPCRD